MSWIARAIQVRFGHRAGRCTAHNRGAWTGLVARSIYAAGGRPGHIVHVAYGYGLFTGGLGCPYGAERLGCSVVPPVGRARRVIDRRQRNSQAQRDRPSEDAGTVRPGAYT